MTDVDEFIVEHHGVKGMHWGVRNKRKRSGFRFQTSSVNVDSSLHKDTQVSAREVASLVSSRYGFNISEVKNIKTGRPDEYKYGTAAFVESTPGQRSGTIFIRPEDMRKDMADTEKTGWMKPGTANVRGLLTHESAHAMFHADQKPTLKARDKAMAAAANQATKDKVHDILNAVSGYAAYSGTREEVEAEMFSQYHWGTNTPAFIQVWGQTLHEELGVDPTPFKEAMNHG